jgi:hypothetical protein
MQIWLCGTAATSRVTVQPPDDMSEYAALVEYNDREKLKGLEKICPSTQYTLSITNPISTALGANPCLQVRSQQVNTCAMVWPEIICQNITVWSCQFGNKSIKPQILQNCWLRD